MFPGISGYAMSKAATSKFTEGLQIEMAKFGVRVIGIEPWAVNTNMLTGQQMPDSLLKRWSDSPQAIKSDYGLEYLKNVMRSLFFIINFPIQLKPEDVVSSIVDNLLCPEPLTVDRVINSSLKWPLFLLNDVLSWEVVVLIRQITYYVLFKLLSLGYFKDIIGREIKVDDIRDNNANVVDDLS